MKVLIWVSWDTYQTWFASGFTVDGVDKNVMATDVDSAAKCLRNLNEGKFLPPQPIRLSQFKTADAYFTLELDQRSYEDLSKAAKLEKNSIEAYAASNLGVSQIRVIKLS